MIKKGNQVIVLCGKDKGKKGGIISKENFIHVSNLKILESDAKKTKDVRKK